MFTLDLNTHVKRTPANPISQILGTYGIFGWFVILIIYNLFLSTLQKTCNLNATIMTVIIISTLLPLLLYQFKLAWFFITSKKSRLKITINKSYLEFQPDPKKKPGKASIKKIHYRFYHNYRRKQYSGPSLLMTIPGYPHEIIIECRCDFDLIQWRKPEKDKRLYNSGNILIDENTFCELLGLLKLNEEIKHYKLKT